MGCPVFETRTAPDGQLRTEPGPRYSSMLSPALPAPLESCKADGCSSSTAGARTRRDPLSNHVHSPSGFNQSPLVRRPGDRRLSERTAARMRPGCNRQPNRGRSVSAKNPTLPERPVEQAAGHTTSLIRLSATVDDEVDCNSKPMHLIPQPSVLLTAPLKVRLDHDQVEVTVRPSISMGARPEQND